MHPGYRTLKCNYATIVTATVVEPAAVRIVKTVIINVVIIVCTKVSHNVCDTVSDPITVSLEQCYIPSDTGKVGVFNPVKKKLSRTSTDHLR